MEITITAANGKANNFQDWADSALQSTLLPLQSFANSEDLSVLIPVFWLAHSEHYVHSNSSG